MTDECYSVLSPIVYQIFSVSTIPGLWVVKNDISVQTKNAVLDSKSSIYHNQDDRGLF